jgi:hypothetical protein
MFDNAKVVSGGPTPITHHSLSSFNKPIFQI